VRVTFEELALPGVQPERDIVALDDALAVLETMDPRRSKVVELRIFAGLSVEETAHRHRRVGRHRDAALEARESVAAPRTSAVTAPVNGRSRTWIWGMARPAVSRGDIATFDSDAIVNAANESLLK
jgi:hypothetical protein